MNSTEWDDEAIACWVVTLHEPLTDPDVAANLSAQARRAMAGNQEPSCVWAAGVVSDQLDSLPDEDPWRDLHRRRPPGGSGAAAVPATAMGFQRATTAARGQQWSGTFRDATDLVPPGHANLLLDHELIAVAKKMPQPSADFMAACSSSWKQGAAELRRHAEAGRSVFDVAAPAIRWSAWRRRVYTGRDDTWLLESSHSWITRCRQMTDDLEVDVAGRDDELDEARIDAPYSPLEGP